MSKVVKIISDVLFITGLLIAGLILVSRFTSFHPLRIFVVSSGSMTPAIPTGSIVVTVPQTHYRVGDVVTFYTGNDNKTTTTHRLVALGDGVIRTAGDANSQPDPALTPASQIIGRVYSSLPFVGYLAGFAQTPRGFILLVIVPATIIVYEELRGMFAEFKKHLKNLPSPKFWREAGGEAANPAIILPVIFGGLIFFTFSGSFFTDTATSTGNSFTAWIPTPPPLLHLVINEVSPTGRDKNEWVELFNPTNSSINISGWKIADALTDDTFPATTSAIPANGFAVLIGNNSNVSGIPPSALKITLTNATIGSGLNDSGDTVTLKNPADSVIDQMSYGNASPSAFPSPPAAPNSGKTVSRHPNGVDTDTSSNWLTNTSPTLGTANP